MTTQTASHVPAWLASQRCSRGLCEDCGKHPPVTYWQSLDGSRLCRGCCEIRQEREGDRDARGSR